MLISIWIGGRLTDTIFFSLTAKVFFRRDNQSAAGDMQTTESNLAANIAESIEGPKKPKLLNPGAGIPCNPEELLVFSGKKPENNAFLKLKYPLSNILFPPVFSFTPGAAMP